MFGRIPPFVSYPQIQAMSLVTWLMNVEKFIQIYCHLYYTKLMCIIYPSSHNHGSVEKGSLQY